MSALNSDDNRVRDDREFVAWSSISRAKHSRESENATLRPIASLRQTILSPAHSNRPGEETQQNTPCVAKKHCCRKDADYRCELSRLMARTPDRKQMSCTPNGRNNISE